MLDIHFANIIVNNEGDAYPIDFDLALDQGQTIDINNIPETFYQPRCYGKVGEIYYPQDIKSDIHSIILVIFCGKR